MSRTRILLGTALAAVTLSACGSGAPTISSANAQIGKAAQLTTDLEVTLKSTHVSGDAAGPWVRVRVRIANNDSTDISMPIFGIVCNGSQEGSLEVSSPLSFASSVPANGSTSGEFDLLAPGDSRTGSSIPLCQGPATVVATTQGPATDGDETTPSQLRWALPQGTIQQLNVVIEKHNRSIG